jgi:hypothetical protein
MMRQVYPVRWRSALQFLLTVCPVVAIRRLSPVVFSVPHLQGFFVFHLVILLEIGGEQI